MADRTRLCLSHSGSKTKTSRSHSEGHQCTQTFGHYVGNDFKISRKHRDSPHIPAAMIITYRPRGGSPSGCITSCQLHPNHDIGGGGGNASLGLSDKHTCTRSSGPGPKRLLVGGQAGQKPGCADRGQVPDRVGAVSSRVTLRGTRGWAPRGRPRPQQGRSAAGGCPPDRDSAQPRGDGWVQLRDLRVRVA